MERESIQRAAAQWLRSWRRRSRAQGSWKLGVSEGRSREPRISTAGLKAGESRWSHCVASPRDNSAG